MKKIINLCFFVFLATLNAVEEKAMVVIIPSYNNSQYYGLNLGSVLNQNYSNYRVIYIDDHSSDGTRERVEDLIKSDPRLRSYQFLSFEDNSSDGILKTAAKFHNIVNSQKTFFTLVSNQRRCGALANQYRAISSCQNQEIVVLIDGDDWLADEFVLQEINEAYSSDEVWLTHGSLVEYPTGVHVWCEPVPSQIIARNTFRKFKCPSHLRTFYAWLFKRIHLEDLLYEGDFFPMTGDMAVMYPMIEMCGERHKFISKPIYIYNMINPINDNKVNADLQKTLDRNIRKKKPYHRLDNR